MSQLGKAKTALGLAVFPGLAKQTGAAQAVLLFAFLIPLCCGAQTFPAATDTELSALYCVGMIRAEIRMVNAEMASTEVKDRPYFEKLLTEREQGIRRLKAYILPRLGQLDGPAIALAAARGEEDSRAHSAVVDDILKRCDTRRCVEAQYAAYEAETGGLWERVNRCRKLNWLPF